MAIVHQTPKALYAAALYLFASMAQAESLDTAWAVALRNNQLLEASRCSVCAAEHELFSAEAERLPAISTRGSYLVRDHQPAFQFDFPGIPAGSGQFPYQQRSSFAAVTAINVPLYTSGRIQHGVESAESRIVAVENDTKRSVQDLKLNVAEAYVTVLRADRARDVAQSNTKSLSAHAADIATLYENAMAPRNDLLAAEVALANAKQNGVRTDNRSDLACAAYNRLLGRPLDAPVQVEERQPQTVQTDLARLTARALHQRPEIASLVARSQSLSHQAESLRAAMKPQFDLRAGYAFEENRFQTFPGIASAGVAVEWNAFDGGRKSHHAAALSHEAESLMRLRADLESAVALEVRRSWLDVQETRQRIEVTRKAIAQAEEALRTANERYAQRRGTSSDVLDSEALRSRSYQDHYDSIYDAVLAVLRLHRAVGDL